MSDMDTDGKHNDDDETETEREGDHDCRNHSESNWLSQSLGMCFRGTNGYLLWNRSVFEKIFLEKRINKILISSHAGKKAA